MSGFAIQVGHNQEKLRTRLANPESLKAHTHIHTHKVMYPTVSTKVENRKRLLLIQSCNIHNTNIHTYIHNHIKSHEDEDEDEHLILVNFISFFFLK